MDTMLRLEAAMRQGDGRKPRYNEAFGAARPGVSIRRG